MGHAPRPGFMVITCLGHTDTEAVSAKYCCSLSDAQWCKCATMTPQQRSQEWIKARNRTWDGIKVT